MATTDHPSALDRPPLLEVEDLRAGIAVDRGTVRAVDGVSFTLQNGRTLGVVGESGSGKTMLAKSIMGLVPSRDVMLGGSVRLDGVELIGRSPKQMRRIWGSEVSMVHQDPMTSLNPVKRIGHQIMEPLRHHLALDKKEARATAVALLESVRIPDPEKRLREYPHQLSGGMRQRVMIAIALACDPRLLIADEPTTALDVTVQAQILDLLQDLQREYGSAIVMITHDLGVIAEIADDVLVMYGGRAVESGPTKTILTLPEMPYTWGLLSSVPDITGDTGARLVPIPGMPPSLLNPPTGCAFHPRCPHVDKVPGDLCRTTLPDLTPASQPGHSKRCHLVNPDEIYLKEVLPETAPDLVDPETGEVVPELQEQIAEIQGETP